MKLLRWMTLACFLLGCQPQSPNTITLIDAAQTQTIQTNERVPLLILTQAGLTVNPSDRVFLNGTHIPLDQPAPITDSVTLQIRRPVALTIVTPQGTQLLQSSALTVGEALNEA